MEKTTKKVRPKSVAARPKKEAAATRKSTFAIIFVLQKGKAREDGTAPIVARITVNHEMVHFATRMYIHPDRWLPKDYRTAGKSREEKQINDALDELRVLIRRRYDQMLRGEETITAAMLKNAITGLDQSASTLLGVCDRFIEDYTDLLRTKQCCRETYLRYLLTRNRLEEFLRNRYRIPDIPVKEIQPRFAAEFDRWLRITYQLTNSTSSAKIFTTKPPEDPEVVLTALNDSLRIKNPLTFTTSLTTDEELYFRLRIENPDRQLVREMAGVIGSSLLMLAAVAGALIYLLRTLFRQKTLEEMRLDLTHNITHELKTPIAVANAANDALLDFGAANDAARRERYLTVIREQLAALGGMVQRILTMSVEERGEFTLRRETLELLPLLEEIAARFRMKGRGRATIEVEAEGADLKVAADRFHLTHALENLVDNALKYSRDEVRIRLSARRAAKGVELRVADNGIGIDRTAQAHIFEKFYRVPTGDRHDVKGFGLGLYYVRLIARRHGGEITVESAPGRGSTFILSLPDDGR